MKPLHVYFLVERSKETKEIRKMVFSRYFTKSDDYKVTTGLSRRSRHYDFGREGHSDFIQVIILR